MASENDNYGDYLEKQRKMEMLFATLHRQLEKASVLPPRQKTLPGVPALQAAFEIFDLDFDHTRNHTMIAYLNDHYRQSMRQVLPGEAFSIVTAVPPSELRKSQAQLLTFEPLIGVPDDAPLLVPGYYYDPQTVAKFATELIGPVLNNALEAVEKSNAVGPHPWEPTAVSSLKMLTLSPGQIDSRLRVSDEDMTLANYLAVMRLMENRYKTGAARFQPRTDIYSQDLWAQLLAMNHLLSAAYYEDMSMGGAAGLNDPYLQKVHLIKGYAMLRSLPAAPQILPGNGNR